MSAMLKIIKKNILPWDFFTKASKEAKVEVFRRHHLVSKEIRAAHSKRQIRAANPDTFISDSYRNSASQIASDANDDDDHVSVTSVVQRLAKNHNVTSAGASPKVQKHASPNNTIISTLPSSSAQTGNSTARQLSPTPAVTSAATGLAVPDTLSSPIPNARPGLTSSALYTVIGAGVLSFVIMALCIWGCWANKRRDEKRRSVWTMTASSRKPDDYGSSSFMDGHLEKPRSADTKMLNSIHGKRLRGDSVSKKGLSGSRDSELWGSKQEIHGYPFPNMLAYSEKQKQKSFYADLDFGPVVMSTFDAKRPPVPSLPPTAHHSDANHDYFAATVVNGAEYDGGYKTRRTSFASMNRVDAAPIQGANGQRDNTRRKKDTIAGLTDAYGNVNGWDEVEHNFSDCPVEHMPTGLVPLQSYLPNPAPAQSNDHTYLPYASEANNLSIPPPALVVNSSGRNSSPEPTSIPFVHPTSTTRHMMSLSEASKELESMVDRLGRDTLNKSSAGNPYDQGISDPRAKDTFYPPHSDSSLPPVLPNLDKFSFDPVPSSETPKILRNVSPTCVDDVSTREVNRHSQSRDVSNYTGQIGQSDVENPGQYSPSLEFWIRRPNDPKPKLSQDSGSRASRVPSFVPLKSPDLTPSFTPQETNHASPTYTNIYTFFDSPGLALPTYPFPMPAAVGSDSTSRQGPSQGVGVDATDSAGDPQDAYHGIRENDDSYYYKSRT